MTCSPPHISPLYLRLASRYSTTLEHIQRRTNICTHAPNHSSLHVQFPDSVPPLHQSSLIRMSYISARYTTIPLHTHQTTSHLSSYFIRMPTASIVEPRGQFPDLIPNSRSLLIMQHCESIRACRSLQSCGSTARTWLSMFASSRCLGPRRNRALLTPFSNIPILQQLFCPFAAYVIYVLLPNDSLNLVRM